MEKLIDANVILRYLLRDNEAMYEEAAKCIEEGNAFTIPEVIAEVVYVLKKVYQVSKVEIRDSLIVLIDTVGVDNYSVIIKALEIYASKSLDFVDCILIARNWVLNEEVFSFDKKLNHQINQDTQN